VAALLADVKAAMAELVAIDNAEFEALIREDVTIEVLRARARVTRENKAALIERYREHVTSHGC
jgi:magnesium-transporting ATPase (P-type)